LDGFARRGRRGPARREGEIRVNLEAMLAKLTKKEDE
jgi:hypothetical protein